MSPLQFTLITFGVSIAAGALGSLLGLGGGIIIVPFLTLWMKIDVHYAIGASIVSVIATSSGAAAAYVRERMTNLRVAMFLEIATTSGAICGAYLAGVLAGRWIYVIFGVVLGYSALVMLRKREDHAAGKIPADALADRLRLHDTFYDEAAHADVPYKVRGTILGFGLMLVAGMVSGLLGIGSGALKVPAMDLAMGLPMKVSSATSNFMIGVTAAASAGVYFARGEIDPFIAAPVVTGVLLGAVIGSKLLAKISSLWIRGAFVVVLLFIAGQMLYKGLLG